MHISQWSKADTKWYLGVNCAKCQTPILFAVDHNDQELRPPGTGTLFLTCSIATCRHQSDYSSAKISRFQKQPEISSEAKKRK